ncbi:MAG: phosphoesterase [Acidimicrobiales bacterium]|nr:phosphoesterase [Acidimicrobiales bacterium]
MVSERSPNEADATADAEKTAPAGPARPAWKGAARVLLGAAWLGAFVGRTLAVGIPIEREQILFWIVTALAVSTIGAGRGRFRRIIIDWLPFALVLIAYEYSRGAASGKTVSQLLHGQGRVNWTPQIRVDRWLGFGQVPTVRLQRVLVPHGRAHLWEAIPSITYLSHFVVPFLVAGVLWVRDRPRWAAYVRRFVVLSFVGVAIFVAFPAAPPWLASRAGYLPPVRRTTGRGWTRLHLEIAQQMIDKGQRSVNLVAAIPSLHAGYSALVLVALWGRSGRLARGVLVGYVLLMGFTLVLTGEHYLIDVLLGWACVALVCVVVGAVERRWQARAGVSAAGR